MRPWQRFEAYTRCHELTVAVYRLTADYPPSELYGLTAQTRRAAFSAAANIVEGATRHGPAQFARHLDIAVGSLAETAYAVELAHAAGFLKGPAAAELLERHDMASRVTWGLLLSMRAATRGRRRYPTA